MKKFKKIYLDMDGVIADFDSLFIETTGMHPKAYEDANGQTAFWDVIMENPNFFFQLQSYWYMPKMISMCLAMADNVVFLSSPAKYNTALCMEQKREWLDQHGYAHMGAIFEKNKYKFARPDCLLIDDFFEKNIIPWNEAGGQSHHFTSFEKFTEFYNSTMGETDVS